MARKKGAGKPKEPVKEVAEEIKEEVQEPVEELVTLIFKPDTPSISHEVKATTQVYDERVRKERTLPLIKSLPAKFEVARGETFQVTKDEFELLVSKGIVRNKEQMAERKRLRGHGIVLAELDDISKALALSDLPYEVTEEK